MFKIDASTSAVLGIVFVILGTATTFLMFHLWGYPFDKATRKSDAPKSLMLLHRVLGFAFVALYIFMMLQMVPRMVRYQVEFPPRTVVHICLGITIGFILLIKVAIIRFFRHLEEWMPYLGTGMLLCTYLLLGLSVPFSLREKQLASQVAGGSALSAANLERVKKQLPAANLPKEAPLDELATKDALIKGREALLTKCVACHDLRTVLTRPRTPADWAKTVERMSDKPVFGDAISEKEQWQTTAYLIAISPRLQSAVKPRSAAAGIKAAMNETTDGDAGAPEAHTFKLEEVKPKFDTMCTGCHELDDIDKHVWKDEAEVKKIMERMIDNGLEAKPEDIAALSWYLREAYAKKKSP
ncbi:MAG: hypothetical protein KC657_14460 [Myxococcales bacterium]|nr:hypothetical protein [Myxococcales bacterium]